MRSLPFYPLMVVLLVGLGGYLGCDPNNIEIPSGLPTSSTASSMGGAGASQFAGTTITASSTIPARTQSTIIIGSFNMQRLGPSKLGNPWVMEKFAEIIRQHDVIALQEITSVDQTTLPRLVQLVNQNGSRYNYAISPRVGRESTGYFEQYAFVFDTSRIQGGADFSYLVSDPEDVLHREPHVGRFKTITNLGPPFQFTLINIHTDPDEVRTELDVLADVYKSVREFEYPEDDVILLGDLNAEPHRLQALGLIPDLIPLIQKLPTNTRKSKTIDNFLVDKRLTREFTSRAGTFDFEQSFRIQLSDAERISDHLPIWAEFSIVEQSNQSVTAGANGNLVR
jgi:endonuclease/exonuclease/phosphatase family metal-dependent hydrolase